MNLLIAGHSVLDTIILAGETKIQPGGIFYTVAGINAVRNKNDKIDLLTQMDYLNYSYFSQQFSEINLINKLTDKRIPSVILETPENEERREKYENFAGNLNLLSIKDSSEYDGMLLNMITGNDVDPDELISFSASIKGKIYFDVHTLARGTDVDGNRNFRKIPFAGKWLSCIDILQANESEILTLDESDNELETVRSILKSRVSLVIVTKGKSGLTCYRNGSRGMEIIEIPAKKAKSINSVGCGDIFGAVFFYSYITGLNLLESLHKAASASALVTSFKDIKQFNSLKNVFNRHFT